VIAIRTALIVGFMSILIFAACSSQPESRQPAESEEATTDVPTVPRPTPVAAALCEDIEQSAVLNEVVRELGFALIPRYVPKGIESGRTSVSGGQAHHVLQNPRGNLIIAYPVEFTPEDTPLMQELGMLRPSDALSKIGLSGETGYMMRGGWSDATIMAGPVAGAQQAEWDYGKSLTLFFDCQVADGREVGVAIQALPNPSEWIAETELIKIALSLARVLPPQQPSSG
jgi:hypothetical protein